MHNKWKPYYLIFGSILLITGCLSEITLDVPESDSTSIAIRGYVKGGAEPFVTVEITGLTDFTKAGLPDPVVGASVVLIDDLNRGLDIPMVAAGVYERAIPPGAFALEVSTGKSYQLSVALPDGRNYLSDFEALHPVPEPLAVRRESVRRDILNGVGNLINQEFIRFLLTTPVVGPGTGERSYLKWDFTGTYRLRESTLDSPFPPNPRTCYITQPLSLERVVTFSGAESNREIVEDLFLLEEPFDYRFSDGFYLSLHQQSLSEGAYRYWNNVGKVVEVSGNFFEAPPGKIKGNFRNVDDPEEEVFGYFYATEETTLRFFVAPGDPRPAPYCPPTARTVESVEAICLNCLLRPGSTTVKPDFWEY